MQFKRVLMFAALSMIGMGYAVYNLIFPGDRVAAAAAGVCCSIDCAGGGSCVWTQANCSGSNSNIPYYYGSCSN